MIDNLIKSFKQFVPDFLSSYCIINGSFLELDKVEKMGYNEFWEYKECLRDEYNFK